MVDRTLLKDLVQTVPLRTPGSDAHFNDEVLEWIGDAGFADTGASCTSGESCSLVLFIYDEGSIGLWKVPDAAISPELRKALDGDWARIFSVEEITHPGQLWMLAYAEAGSDDVYRWLGGALGIDPAALGAAHGRWRDRSCTDLAAVRGAAISRCYGAWLRA